MQPAPSPAAQIRAMVRLAAAMTGAQFFWVDMSTGSGKAFRHGFIINNDGKAVSTEYQRKFQT